MKIILVIVLFAASNAYSQTTMECRALNGNQFVEQNETIVKVGTAYQVCHPVVKGLIGQAVAPVTVAAPVAAPVAATPAAVMPAHQPCLIVTSAEGHRFRNSMIAGALTGGVGLLAGAAFSGGRYEYRDSIGVPAQDVKMKYKGPELKKLQGNGYRIIVVNKKDTTGTEVNTARSSCKD